MIQRKINFKPTFDFIKENLNILIVFPAFIGGLWQAIELMSISFSYIRFFSISQIVPDGILILTFLFFSSSFIVWFSIFKSYVDNIKEDNNYDTEEEREKVRKSIFIKSLLGFIFAYSYMTYSFLYVNVNITKSSSLGWAITFAYIYTTLIIYTLNRCYIYALDKYKKYVKLGEILLIILFGIIVLSLLEGVHSTFSTPNNIINIEKVKSDVQSKFPNTNQTILYFNDKYIFFKITDEHKKDKIFIKKIESLFEE